MTLNTCISSNQTKYRQGIRITSASVIHAYFNTNLHINYQNKNIDGFLISVQFLIGF